MAASKHNRILSKELGPFQTGCQSLVPYCSMRDHCPVPSADHHGLTNEMSMYDASPTALYIYEQEKNDMQCLAPAVLNTTSSFVGSPSMDLPELKQTDVSSCLWNPDKPACSWSLDEEFDSDDLLNMSEIHDLGQINIDEVFQRDEDPTLAELNGPALSAILNNESSQDSWKEWKGKGEWKGQVLQPNPSNEIQASIKKEWDALHDPQETKRRQRRPSEVDKKWEELRQFVDRPNCDGKGLSGVVKLEAGTVSCSQLRRFLTCDEEETAEWKSLKREHEETVVKTEPKSLTQESPVHTTEVQSHGEVPVALHSEDDSDLEEEDQDWSSDAESVDSYHGDQASSSKRRRKEPRYFWQYNAQSKGPKGTKLYIPSYEEDPHVLHVFEDPVFDPEQTSSGNIRHSGKARRGDGNDIMPCPMKLHQIGSELKKLNRVIDQLTPAGDAPVNVKTRSKREKNKLASRACRLKKKAQHEANKIKLHGLEEEHGQLIHVLEIIKREIVDHVTDPYHNTTKAALVDRVERLVKTHLKSMIAGHTTEFVNSVLEKIEGGDPHGGLQRRVY